MITKRKQVMLCSIVVLFILVFEIGVSHSAANGNITNSWLMLLLSDKTSVPPVTNTCAGAVYACIDGLDNDGDSLVDSEDPECLGPCDNTEDSFHPNLPGTIQTCQLDSFWDGDSGSGNDGCYWSHICDPLEVAPEYYPGGAGCEFDPSVRINGSTCDDLLNSQSSQCTDGALPLTPNGCDCFGCCEVAGSGITVWFGSVDEFGSPSCDTNSLDDPSLCKPCTQVTSCVNTCETCELCVGKMELPPECNLPQQCPAGTQVCGLLGQSACPGGYTCITGCCQENP